uniref:Uncharacterized protein n=1 Tax=Arundo donax TaxID=35708 RepID=A0A0A9DKY0_ARUDO
MSHLDIQLCMLVGRRQLIRCLVHGKKALSTCIGSR